MNMKIEAQKVEATKITVNVNDNYNDALTAIFNNWREDRRIYNVCNNHKNDIYVTVKSESTEDAIEWLSVFGSIKNTQKVLVALIDSDDLSDYDLDKYSDFIISIN